MNGFQVDAPTLVTPHRSPYLLQIPVWADDPEHALRIASQAAQRAALLEPRNIDAAASTLIATQERQECLLICNRKHWSGRRCTEPYGHVDGCPEPK